MAAKAKHLFSTKVELSKSNMFFFSVRMSKRPSHVDLLIFTSVQLLCFFFSFSISSCVGPWMKCMEVRIRIHGFISFDQLLDKTTDPNHDRAATVDLVEPLSWPPLLMRVWTKKLITLKDLLTLLFIQVLVYMSDFSLFSLFKKEPPSTEIILIFDEQ